MRDNNMEKYEHVYKTYKRNHKGDNFEELEISKISKAKNTIKKLEKQSKKMMNHVSITLEEDEFADEYDEIFLKMKKISGSSKTHKKRLKELQRNAEFR
jgi:hypothetical protein